MGLKRDFRKDTLKDSRLDVSSESARVYSCLDILVDELFTCCMHRSVPELASILSLAEKVTEIQQICEDAKLLNNQSARTSTEFNVKVALSKHLSKLFDLCSKIRYTYIISQVSRLDSALTSILPEGLHAELPSF